MLSICNQTLCGAMGNGPASMVILSQANMLEVRQRLEANHANCLNSADFVGEQARCCIPSHTIGAMLAWTTVCPRAMFPCLVVRHQTLALMPCRKWPRADLPPQEQSSE